MLAPKRSRDTRDHHCVDVCLDYPGGVGDTCSSEITPRDPRTLFHGLKTTLLTEGDEGIRP